MSLDGRAPVEGLGCEGVMDDSLDETTKENASAVNSSLTECKHDRENCDGTESSFDKDNEESNGGKEGERIHAFGEADNPSSMKNDRGHSTRYFIIKSLSHHNIQLSVDKGIWATQVMNEPILEEAFHNSGRVILIFSVNMSGFFQGYAQMMSSIGWRRDNVWSRSSGGSNQWGRTFEVKWLRLHDLPFQKTLHLKNPLNDYKPVKISRDCQELSEDVGEALCGLFDGEVDIKGKFKRNDCFIDDILLKRPCSNSPLHFQDEDHLLSVPSSHLSWAGSTMLHPSLLYQHVTQHEEHSCRVSQERSPRDSFVKNSPSYIEPHRVMSMKQSHVQESLGNRQGDHSAFLQPNKRDVPREGNHAVTLSEEDILNMTYEEYLEAVGGSFMPSPHLAAAGQQWATQGSDTSRDHRDDDRYSRYLADWHHSKKVKSHIQSSN